VTTTEPGFEAYVASADGLAQALVKGLAEPWLIVEHKGPAVTFHFRASPDVAAAGALVRTWVDRLDPDGRFVRHAGARMLELRPPGATTKARAMRALLAEVRPRSALVLGVGSTDAAAVQALREAAQASGGALSGLSLAVRSHGSPLIEVEAAADAVIASPAAVATLLRGLARSVRPVSGSRPVRPVSGSRMPPPGPWG
jgi:trehalose-6-phosphatase